MKANKISDRTKSRFSFEAPIMNAALKAGMADKNSNDLLDLNRYLAPDPKNTFLVRANGESMIDKNIDDGDILVVDSREPAIPGKVVIASLNGELLVKTLEVRSGQTYLVSANKKFVPIRIASMMDLQIQGVVKHVIKDY